VIASGLQNFQGRSAKGDERDLHRIGQMKLEVLTRHDIIDGLPMALNLLDRGDKHSREPGLHIAGVEWNLVLELEFPEPGITARKRTSFPPSDQRGMNEANCAHFFSFCQWDSAIVCVVHGKSDTPAPSPWGAASEFCQTHGHVFVFPAIRAA